MYAVRFQKPLSGIIPTSLLLFYIFIAIKLVWGYFLWDFTFFLGLALAPYICTIEKGKLSLRYLIPCALTLGLALIVPVKTMFFFALFFTVMLLIENFKGKISLVVFFLIILVSPFFKYMSDLISFPIRLGLSEAVTNILSGAGLNVVASGNIIIMNGCDFLVDQACAGLKMLSTSLIICLFIIAFYQKKVNSQLGFTRVVLFMLLTFILNIGCNLVRILLLVYFKIMPNVFLHDLVGFLCLILYVILPLLFLSRFYFHRYVKTKQPKSVTEQSILAISDLRYTGLHISLFLSILFISFNLKKIDKINDPTANNKMILKGYHKEVLESTVIKFENEESLIYIKSTPFYAAEHNPMVCWKGSGYEFKSIKKENFAGKEIYTGLLVKGKDKIYTAWWFDNGKMITSNQLNWRWEAATGKTNFYLVNVNALNENDLKKTVLKMINRKIYLNLSL
ncbi:MAG: exosortase N [Daejeonella sp.]